MADRHGFLVRLFGWGLSFVDGRWLKPTYSERNGHIQVLRIGRLRIQGYRP